MKNKKEKVQSEKTIKSRTEKASIKNQKMREKYIQLFLLSDETVKKVTTYHDFKITETPNRKFPEMVSITRINLNGKAFLEKRFVNLQKAKEFINAARSSQIIEKKKSFIKNNDLKDEFMYFTAQGAEEYENWLYISNHYKRAGLNTERRHDY